ncbi:MAG: zinc ribbon domain-containing protein [Ruminococcaceae bacterium]|nr:zinc ribbon domain-containing protein [Oscillospiraceae bacterium]
MKNCPVCGNLVKDDEKTCAHCRHNFFEDADHSNVASSAMRDPLKYSKEAVEEKIAKYYNDTYLAANSSGKYIVLSDETSVEGTVCNVIVRYLNDNEDSVPIADVSMDMLSGECKISSRSAKKKKSDAPISSRNILSIVLVVAAAIAWMAAPFIAITGYQKGDQLSALAILIGDFTMIGEVYETRQFWVAIASAICMVICFVCLCKKEGGAARVSALICDGIMSLILVQVYNVSYNFSEGLEDFIGSGFWIIFALMLIVAFVSEKQD